MSDNSDDDSLFSNLKNKLKYKLHKAAYDPDANKFATEEAQKRKEAAEKAKELKDKSDTATTDTTQPDGTPSDPNKFNGVRLAKKVGNQTLDILKKIFFPFIALMMAMIVTNELIIYAAPIRIVFFIFTLGLCMFSHTIAIILSLYYLFKGGYSYYRNTTDKPAKYLMPTIFALMPITTFKPMSSFGSFFLYPFTYPKSEKAAQILPDIMNHYWDNLRESFKDFDKIKNLPIFADDIKDIQNNLLHLHDSSRPINISPENSARAQNAQNAQYSGERRAMNREQAARNAETPKPSAPPHPENSAVS